MKLNKALLAVVGASLLAMSAGAQVTVTITGSTAFRSITFDRVQSLFDAGYSAIGDFNTGPGTYTGTMSNAIPSLHNTPVTVRLSFSGSGAGMLAVDQSTPVPTVNPGTGTTNNVVPDLALSDVFPESATPSINGSDLEQVIVGVIPFLWVKNNALAGISNITREQAQLLCTSSGVVTNGVNLIPGMPASYLGGVSTNPIYMTGRDSGSGTRITTFACIGFTGTPREWGLAAGGVLTLTNGYSSGGNERSVIAGNTNVIGYLGVADATAIAASASPISFEGVAFSTAAVQSGNYPLWGYEHFVNRTSGLSANQAAIRDALVAAITNQGYQTTNTLYTSSFVDQARMQVQRGTDGGTITSLNF
jgi:hypothetical protein